MISFGKKSKLGSQYTQNSDYKQKTKVAKTVQVHRFTSQSHEGGGKIAEATQHIFKTSLSVKPSSMGVS